MPRKNHSNMLSCLHLVMPFRRNYPKRRSSQLGTVINSYKQVAVDGPASRAAATNITHNVAIGIDDYSGPTANNNEVPTGAVIKNITFLLCFTNLVSVSALLHLNIELKLSGQSSVTPGVVGGNPQRNQVYHTMMKFLGQNQNHNFVVNFKIPKRVQRVREGNVWQLVYRCDTVFASATQAIYKFYR